MLPTISDPIAPDTATTARVATSDWPASATGGIPLPSDVPGHDAAATTPSPVLAAPLAVGGPRPVPHELGPANTAERVWLRAAALRPASVVAVSSADGGVGRSTLAAALGSLLALAVPGPVMAVDMHPVPWGGLSERVGRSRPGTMWDAVLDLPHLTSRRHIERWTQPGPSGLLALVGETHGQGRRPPRHDEAAAVVEAVRRHYPLTVCDVMPALIAGVWRTLAAAQAPVLVARATTDSLHHTMQLLALLRAAGHGRVADQGVLAVVATSPSTGRAVRAVVRQAATVIPAVYAVPFDPLLARPEPIDVRRLHRLTRHALVELADAVLSRCVDPRFSLPAEARKGGA